MSESRLNKYMDNSEKKPVPDIQISEDIRDQIKELVRDIENSEPNTEAIQPTQRETSDANEALVNVISEFLDGFAIIGFDFDGVPVCISSASTMMKKEAVDSLVTRYTMMMQ